MSDLGETTAAPLPAAEPLVMLTPVQRLALSRERLRQVLSPPPAADESAAAGAGKSWEQRLRAIPGVALAVDVVQAWWQQHPLRAATMVARELSGAALRPVAGRHPFALLAAAVVVGAALAWARPWRWALKSALFAGLVPQFASRVARALPIENWLNVLATLISRPRPSAAAETDTAHPSATPTAAAAATPATGSATGPANAPEPAHAH